MAIREIEIDVNGIVHTVQVNENDKSGLYANQKSRETKAEKPAEKARTPRNKAARPAANKVAAAAETATDPGASEA